MTDDRFPAGLDRDYRMLIGDEWVAASDGATFTCVDPYTGQPWGRVPVATAGDVDRAVRAARAAFPGWARRAPASRARFLRKLGDLLESAVDELTAIQVHENGKLVGEMKPGTQGFAANAHHFGGLAPLVHGETVTTALRGMTSYTVREPLGVVAAITPWNTPLGLLGWKLFPALATGNTIVIKPSEVTPVSTLRLAELILEAGFPPGVVNVVTGAGSAGSALVAHRGVDKIAFTGSTATGRAIARVAAERLIPVTLELGGKGPQIVFADADLDRALDGVMTGMFVAGGQACNAGSRVLVERPVLAEMLDRIQERTAALTMGDPLDPATTLPPVACRPQLDRVTQFLELGHTEGVTIVAGGARPSGDGLDDGFFVQPTVYTDVPLGSALAREEIFGPVAVVLPFESEDEAVTIANDTDYGLVAGCWTESLSRAHRMIARLHAGTVWINTWRSFDPVMPFGGYRQSGVGRELGLAALDEYTQVKAVWIQA